MKKVYLCNIINSTLFIYILSIYLLTYREGLNSISNAIAFILAALIWMNFLLTRRKLIFNKVLFLFLIFICICMISVYFALNANIAITKVKTLILIYIVMLSLANYVNDFDKLRKLMTYFIYSGFVASIYILTNSNFYKVTRYGSVLGNVNAMGVIIGISATFCFYIILCEKKYLYSFFLLVMIPTILLTGSRQSIMFVFMNIFIIFYFMNRKSLNNRLKFISIIVLISLFAYYLIFSVPLFYQIIGRRLENIFYFVLGKEINESSLSVRADMIRIGFELFMSKPISGYGVDNYRILYSNLTNRASTYAHNNYIDLLVGTGIFGVFVYYLIHIIILKDLLVYSRQVDNKTIYFVFIAIIISYMILSFAKVYYYEKYISYIFAVASVITKIDRDEKLKIKNSKE